MTDSYFHDLVEWATRSVPARQGRDSQVLMALVLHADEHGLCAPTQTEIAEVVFDLPEDQVTDRHREQVRKSLRSLEDLGLVETTHRPGRGRGSIHRVTGVEW